MQHVNYDSPGAELYPNFKSYLSELYGRYFPVDGDPFQQYMNLLALLVKLIGGARNLVGFIAEPCLAGDFGRGLQQLVRGEDVSPYMYEIVANSLQMAGYISEAAWMRKQNIPHSARHAVEKALRDGQIFETVRINFTSKEGSPQDDIYILPGIKVLHFGKNVYKGTVEIELRDTIAKIESGELAARVPYQNRENYLPVVKNEVREDYYLEFVYITPGLKYPGPQRIFRGKKGKLYYTPDHTTKKIYPLN